jgi:hypothetical protein
MNCGVQVDCRGGIAEVPAFHKCRGYSPSTVVHGDEFTVVQREALFRIEILFWSDLEIDVLLWSRAQTNNYPGTILSGLLFRAWIKVNRVNECYVAMLSHYYSLRLTGVRTDEDQFFF